MSFLRQFGTANRLIEFLAEYGRSKSQTAEDLGVSRATLASWQNAEDDRENPTTPPTAQQLHRLAQIVGQHAEAYLTALVKLLETDTIHLPARRAIAAQLRSSTNAASSALDPLVESWDSIENELAQLVSKYGDSILSQLAESAGSALEPRFEKAAVKQKVESAKALPAELQGKSYRYKYEAVFEVLMQASYDDSAAELAARVRAIHPQGTFLPYRIGEDIRHLLRGDGVYSKLHTRLTKDQIAHLERLLTGLQRRGDLGR